MVWKHPSSPFPAKAKTVRSERRFVFIFFMNSQVILLQHTEPKEITGNAEYHQHVSKKKYMQYVQVY